MLLTLALLGCGNNKGGETEVVTMDPSTTILDGSAGVIGRVTSLAATADTPATLVAQHNSQVSFFEGTISGDFDWDDQASNYNYTLWAVDSESRRFLSVSTGDDGLNYHVNTDRGTPDSDSYLVYYDTSASVTITDLTYVPNFFSDGTGADVAFYNLTAERDTDESDPQFIALAGGPLLDAEEGSSINLTNAPKVYVDEGVSTMEVAGTTDIDGDGVGDLLLRSHDTSDVSLILGGVVDEGTYSYQLEDVAEETGATADSIRSGADFDGDGNADVLLTNDDTVAAYGYGYHEDDASTWHFGEQFSIAAVSTETEVGDPCDVDGDGWEDIAVVDNSQSVGHVLLGPISGSIYIYSDDADRADGWGSSVSFAYDYALSQADGMNITGMSCVPGVVKEGGATLAVSLSGSSGAGDWTQLDLVNYPF